MLLTVRQFSVRSQVQLDHDSAVALEDVVWLVNTDDPRTGVELLPDTATLLAYLDRQRVTGTRAGTVEELAGLHRLRAQLRAVFELAAAGRDGETIEAVNELIASYGPMPQLVRHDDMPLHLHFTPSDAPLARRFGAETAIALAILIRDGGVARLSLCAAPACGRALVDLTKNQSRRYCDAQCANRVHAAAYRKRH
jgi:predicted RNA-binding Zn ribbon-like protein